MEYENKLKILSQLKDSRITPERSRSAPKQRKFSGGQMSTQSEDKQTKSNQSSKFVFVPEMLSPEEIDSFLKMLDSRSTTNNSISNSDSNTNSNVNLFPSNQIPNLNIKSNTSSPKFSSFSQRDHNPSNIKPSLSPQSQSQSHRYPNNPPNSIDSTSNRLRNKNNVDQSVDGSIQSIPSQSSSVIANITLEGRERVLKLIQKLDNLSKT